MQSVGINLALEEVIRMVRMSSTIIACLKDVVTREAGLNYLERGGSLKVVSQGKCLLFATGISENVVSLEAGTWLYHRFDRDLKTLATSGTEAMSALLGHMLKAMCRQLELESKPFPVLFVNTTRKSPRQIFIAALMGAIDARYIHVPSLRRARSKAFYSKIFRKITAHYAEFQGVIFSFGGITGYTLWLSDSHGMRFDTRGRFLDESDGIFPENCYTIKIK